MPPVLQIEHIKKSYGRKEVLTDIILSAKQGECIGILGSNGCGKSTLLSILAGIRKPDKGILRFYEENPLKKRSLFSSYVGYVPQENPLMEQLSVYDNLRFWYADTTRSLKADLSDGVPAMFGLNDILHTTVHKLSGGMKKRLSIACALAKEPPLLILDEPGASLDFVCKEDIKCYLNLYLKHGGTVLLTSHEKAELSITNRCVLLKDGILHPLEDSISTLALTALMR